MPIFEPALITYIIFALIILLGVSFIFIAHLYDRLKKITAGSQGSFEEIITEVQGKLTDYETFKKHTQEAHLHLENKTSLIKGSLDCFSFKAFDGLGGGKNSFIVPFLNEHGDGFLLSTIDTRERVNIFAKSVENWKSERPLTDEEEQVLTNVKK